MLIKEASEKWNISERRIRKLIQDGRISGATKKGNTWEIPSNQSKPIDKRYSNKKEYIIGDFSDKLKEIDNKLSIINKSRPLNKETLKSLKESNLLEWTYNSNAIEGNTMTLTETKVVLEGLTIGGKSIIEHLEIINHKEAINYLEELVQTNSELSEWEIKCIHALVLYGINKENAGKYRDCNVLISGAKWKPYEHYQVPEEMEKLIINYDLWDKYHPLIRATLLHSEFVNIHPFIDGNGRTARLLMNFEAMKYGYLPIIIKKDKKSKYYDALDKAATTHNLNDFIEIILEEENNILDQYISLIKK